jgi:hypothetical protein
MGEEEENGVAVKLRAEWLRLGQRSLGVKLSALYIGEANQAQAGFVQFNFGNVVAAFAVQCLLERGDFEWIAPKLFENTTEALPRLWRRLRHCSATAFTSMSGYDICNAISILHPV